MKKLLLLALMLLLTGCQTLSTRGYMADGKPLGNHYLPWRQRLKQLNSLSAWNASGSIAARNQIKGGWSASFNWQQQNRTNYILALFGPLGTNHIEIDGKPNNITLKTSRQTYIANNPETLLQQQVGWRLPVSNLPYWLRGLPAPYSHATHYSHDMNNHMVYLAQDGWEVRYLRYVSVNGIDVPDRILLTNPPWVAHIVIHQWQLN